MSANNGGSAFPMQEPQAIHAVAVAAIDGITDPDERDREYIKARAEAVGGMSLRDYLAAHADIGNVDELSITSGVRLLGTPCPEFKDDTAGCFAWWADYRAKLRYIEADAMLKARES